MTTVVTTDYTLGVGQTLTATNTSGLEIQGTAWTDVTLAGRVVVTSSLNNASLGGILAEAIDDGPHTLTITATGSLSMQSPGLNLAYGIGGSGPASLKLVNAGVIDIQAKGEGEGVSWSSGGVANSGSITVVAQAFARGVALQGGGTLLNSGTILASGGGANAILLYQSSGHDFVNSGTIKAISTDPTTPSVAVDYAGFFNLTNSGLIQGDVALALHRDGILSGDGRMSDITNTGTLRGKLLLNNETFEPVIIHNSGFIDGAVTLNDGADTYSGASGSVSGIVHGDDGADSLAGGLGAETFNGDAGADTIDGGGGADVLDGGDGVDVLSFAAQSAGITLDVGAQTVSGSVVFHNFEQYVAGQGDDVIRGSTAADTLSGAGGADTINGGQGDDRIDGGAGDNYLRGEEGNDSIAGGLGFDNVNGNTGGDTIDGGAGGNDWLLGGQGADLITVHTGAAILNGNLGADTVTGGDGADVVRGGQGADILNGGAGNDLLFGDRGNDALTGGAGADTFHFGVSGGQDRVTDFNAAGGDHVQLDGAGAYTVAASGSDTVVDLGNGDQLTLVGVLKASLPAGWIVLT